MFTVRFINLIGKKEVKFTVRFPESYRQIPVTGFDFQKLLVGSCVSPTFEVVKQNQRNSICSFENFGLFVEEQHNLLGYWQIQHQR